MPRPTRQGPTTLESAFRMLGHGRSVRELVLVQRALREAGVELGSAGDDGFAELVELAEHSGSSGLVALDLITDLSGLLVAGEG